MEQLVLNTCGGLGPSLGGGKCQHEEVRVSKQKLKSLETILVFYSVFYIIILTNILNRVGDLLFPHTQNTIDYNSNSQ